MATSTKKKKNAIKPTKKKVNEHTAAAKWKANQPYFISNQQQPNQTIRTFQIPKRIKDTHKYVRLSSGMWRKKTHTKCVSFNWNRVSYWHVCAMAFKTKRLSVILSYQPQKPLLYHLFDMFSNHTFIFCSPLPAAFIYLLFMTVYLFYFLLLVMVMYINIFGANRLFILVLIFLLNIVQFK